MSSTHTQGSRFAGTTDVIVIGAGQAGLASSYFLSEDNIDHIVLERGEIANSWRNERWDSLQLLTPNWQTRLPGYYYDGDDPDGYMGMSDLVAFMERYAHRCDTPIRTQTTVTSVKPLDDKYLVCTNRGSWVAKCVIFASGACNTSTVPKVAADFPEHVAQLTPHQYRSPQQVGNGAVLVVGASASGMQIADELLDAGRDVTIAVGEHVRMPRHYRGRDILYWMDQCGILDQRYDEVEDIARGRNLPSSQLVGNSNREILDLNSLTEKGAQVAGRLMAVKDGQVQFSGGLRNVCALADLKMRRLLSTIDESLPEVTRRIPGERFADTRVGSRALLKMGMTESNIQTVIWATGFRPDYSWLDVPVLNSKGQLRHDGGIVDAPGLYVLGLPLMRRRKSSFIFGIEDDARDITAHLSQYLHSGNTADDIYQHNSRTRRYRRSA